MASLQGAWSDWEAKATLCKCSTPKSWRRSGAYDLLASACLHIVTAYQRVCAALGALGRRDSQS